MRVYVSGAMRGFPNHNLPEFTRVGDLLHDRGYDVLNPADTRIPEGSSRETYLLQDFQLILVADAIVVHGPWRSSPGARIEVAMGWSLGIPVYFMHEYNGDFHLLHIREHSVVIPSEANKAQLIGLCGFAKAGKDTFANVLVQAGWSRVAFADPLKAVAKALGWDGSKNEGGRTFLQDLGLAVRDELDEDAWVRKAEEIMDFQKNATVLTDVRFQNEVQMVRRRGGALIWINRPGIGPANGHISEHAVTEEDCDVTFTNDGSLATLDEDVWNFMVKISTPVLPVMA